MSRCVVVVAIVLAFSPCAPVVAEGISLLMPETGSGNPFVSDSSLAAPNPFVSSNSPTTTPALIPAPPASLLAPASGGSSRAGVAGGIVSSDSQRLANPLAHLAGNPTSVLSSSDRFGSGAAGQVASVSTITSTAMPQFALPTSSVGASAASPFNGSLQTPFAPSTAPKVYFGAH